MYCVKCGNKIPNGSDRCGICGHSMQLSAPPQQLESSYPMKWYKFLIYFGLIVGPLSNFATGIYLITGVEYGDQKDLVYALFADLQVCDIIYGMYAIGLAVLGLYTRSCLAKFKSNGPAMLLTLYIASVIGNLGYALVTQSVLPAEVVRNLDYSQHYGNAVASIIMAFINRSYFNNRVGLFIVNNT